MLRMSERLPPAGYRVLHAGDRQALHTVSVLFPIYQCYIGVIPSFPSFPLTNYSHKFLLGMGNY